jgi:hypothetical protein
VSLQILQPANGATFTGSGAATLRGRVTSSGHPALFPKWYSSLVAPPTPSSREAAIPVPAGGDPLNFAPAGGLPLGSQIITLAAKDQPGESPDELKAVQHAGMAGGPAVPPGNPAPCVVHVFIADARAPASGATLSKAAAVLAARAPSQWGKKADSGTGFVLNPAYHAINRLHYRWRFAPSGPPAGRASAQLAPDAAQLAFIPAGSEGAGTPPVPLVRYAGALPAALGTGSYILTLRVEDTQNPALGHETSVPIGIAP